MTYLCTGPFRQSFVEGLVEVGAADIEIELTKNGLGGLMELLERLGSGTFGEVHKVRYAGTSVCRQRSQGSPGGDLIIE